MNHQILAIRKLLEQSFADRKLSRSERRALRVVLEEEYGDDAEAISTSLRTAFEIADEALKSERERDVLSWLRGVTMQLAATPRRDEDDSDIRSSVYFSPGEECLHALRGSLERARRELDICVFTITDNRISRAIEAAHQRGVAVRIISDDMKREDLGSDVHALAAAGIPVRTDRNEEAHMHHKFAVIDRRVVITGSFNWTRSATERNHENIVVSGDATLVEPYQQQFDLLWAAFAEPS